ncbi:hypothetical protein PHSC3_001467 [Chlamydiales bacterium STE3]|nr:hypothetical protein PHSC3_001467 [Chlamydiales bacterium STE3]
MKENLKCRFNIVLDAKYQEHLTGKNHPETPERTLAIQEALKNANLFSPEEIIHPKLAKIEDILLCHTPEYVSIIQNDVQHCRHLLINDGSYTLTTGDVQICSSSLEIALLAVGGVIEATDKILQNEIDTAFCVVRPPGHHACSNKGMGFCLFNNVAVAAKHALIRHRINKVLIVDWDVHHGNGTQAIFADDPSVFYFSTHQWPLFPGTGRVEDQGLGNIMNRPISPGALSRIAVLNAFQKDLAEAMEQFQPELIFISAGFDAHYLDPLGGMNLTEKDFGELTRIVKNIAKHYSKGKVISVLEGGYNLNALALSSLEHVKALREDI